MAERESELKSMCKRVFSVGCVEYCPHNREKGYVIQKKCCHDLHEHTTFPIISRFNLLRKVAKQNIVPPKIPRQNICQQL